MTDPQVTQLSDVFSIGQVAIPEMPRGPGGGGAVGLPEVPTRTIKLDEPPPEPETVWTQEAADAENRRQAECAAQKYGEEVQSRVARGNKVEHFSLTWKKDGNNVTSEVREATGRSGNLPVGSAVTSTDFNNLSNSSGGISLIYIMGYNHNHAADIYCDVSGLLIDRQRRDNQKPSHDDRLFADAITVDNIDHGLVLYVRDCEGNIRAFPYSDRDAFKSGAIPVPDPISPDGCDEAE